MLFFASVQVDYLIIGQGISGTFLSYELLKAGKSLMVVDKYDSTTASRVASGMINPVTGRRLARTWIIEDLLPFAEGAYAEIGEFLGIEAARQVRILNFHATEQMSSAWYDRVDEGEEYLQHLHDAHLWEPYFNFNHGIGVTDPCFKVDLDKLLPVWRIYLKGKESLLEEGFSINDCEIGEKGINYKGVLAEKIIFCDGVAGSTNPYFKNLPFALSKGEAITVNIPDLPQGDIYKQGMNLVPLGDDKFWVGSSFEWNYPHAKATEDFRQKVITLLDKWLKLPYEIVDHQASIRPGCMERRPFVGMHPLHPRVGIFNGMGTKGCSLAPYFAHQFTEHLLHGKEIHPKAHITRYEKLLSR